MMLIPSAVITAPPSAAGRNTGPLSQVAGIQALFDLDATLSGSYSGSGTGWANLIASPDDGAAQTDYDFSSVSSPVFTGTAGDAGAYFALTGSNYFQIAGGNTALIKNIAKTTGGAPVTMVMALRTPASFPTYFDLFGTAGSSSGYGFLNTIRSVPGLYNYLYRGGGASQSTGAAITASTDYLIFMVIDYSGASGQHAVNARTLSSNALPSGAVTADCTGTMQIGADGAGGAVHALSNSGYRIYGAYMFNKALSDTEVSAVVDILNSRHARAYA